MSCAGSPVWLTPATPHFRWISELPDARVAPALARPDLAEYIRTSFCDVEGRFAFDSVPAGDYLAGTVIEWEIPNPAFGVTFTASATMSQGGPTFVDVSVPESGTVTVAVTN